jgi:hypothetical protein
MGRVMPRDFVKAVGEYLDQAAPARKKEMTNANKARTEELVDADEDLALDAAGTGAMALGAVVLASFETLLPLFDGTSAARSSCSSTPWARSRGARTS